MVLGSQMRYGNETSFDEDRVPVIAQKRMRQANFFGLSIDMDSLIPLFPLDLTWGYTSGEKKSDIANYANLIDTEDWDLERAFACLLNSNDCVLNKPNITLSQSMGYAMGGITTLCGLFASGSWVDDHWDGSNDPQVACGVRYYGFGAQICWGDVVQYFIDVCTDGGFEQGVPKYDWQTDLNNVGWAHYHYDDTGAEVRPDGNSRGTDNNVLGGPSIAVVGVKRPEDIRGLRGFGINNEYPIRALARSQVYYLRNPNRPDERPSLLNPHWVPRLAPIESEDSPALLRKGLPFLSSFGSPIKPTH